MQGHSPQVVHMCAVTTNVCTCKYICIELTSRFTVRDLAIAGEKELEATYNKLLAHEKEAKESNKRSAVRKHYVPEDFPKRKRQSKGEKDPTPAKKAKTEAHTPTTPVNNAQISSPYRRTASSVQFTAEIELLKKQVEDLRGENLKLVRENGELKGKLEGIEASHRLVIAAKEETIHSLKEMFMGGVKK